MLGIAAALSLPAAAAALQFAEWGTAQKIDETAGNSTELNTPSLDGCPIQAPDGLSLYIASKRPARERAGSTSGWRGARARCRRGAPQNLGERVDSAADDFCPTPVRGDGLFFVSREPRPGACGQGDVYFTRRNGAGGVPSRSVFSVPR